MIRDPRSQPQIAHQLALTNLTAAFEAIELLNSALRRSQRPHELTQYREELQMAQACIGQAMIMVQEQLPVSAETAEKNS